MTLIAKYSINGFNMVFGDLLTTGSISNDARPIKIPTQGNVNEFFGDCGWGISGLNQKVNLISDNCIIAWAGEWIGAKIVISDLHRLSKIKNLTVDDLLNIIDNNPELEKHPVQLVGLIFDQNEIIGFSSEAEEFESKSLQNVCLGGTGGDAIRQFSQLLNNVKNIAEGNVNVVAEGIASSLFLGSLLLNTEFREGTSTPTLLNMFGGGYEIAFFADGKMQKLAEVTFLFWQATLTETGCLVSYPELIVKQGYANDHLLIRSVRLCLNNDFTVSSFDEQNIVVRPMFEPPNRPSRDYLDSLSLSSRILSHCILVGDGSKFLGISSLVQSYSETSKNDLTFHGKGENWTMTFTSTLTEKISAYAEKLRK